MKVTSGSAWYKIPEELGELEIIDSFNQMIESDIHIPIQKLLNDKGL